MAYGEALEFLHRHGNVGRSAAELRLTRPSLDQLRAAATTAVLRGRFPEEAAAAARAVYAAGQPRRPGEPEWNEAEFLADLPEPISPATTSTHPCPGCGKVYHYSDVADGLVEARDFSYPVTSDREVTLYVCSNPDCEATVCVVVDEPRGSTAFMPGTREV